MAELTNEVFYKDFDIRFLAHPITGKLGIKKNTDAIKQAFVNLILTNLGERPYHPTFGSDIRRQLFENYTPFTEGKIRAAIDTAKKNFEPRIEILDISFGGDPDRNELKIDITFQPRNSVQPVTVTLNLERIR